MADFDVKASLSNKSEQKLRRTHASYTRLLFEALYYSHVEPYLEETLGFFAGSTVRLLRYHAACQPGVLLVTLQASSGSAGMLLTV